MLSATLFISFFLLEETTRNKEFRTCSNRKTRKCVLKKIHYYYYPIYYKKNIIMVAIIIMLQTQLMQTLRCNAIVTVALMTYSYSQFTAEQCVHA